MPRTTCLSPDELRALHLGDLAESALQELAAHLESCPQCEAAAQALDGLGDTVTDAYRQSARASPLAPPSSPPPNAGE